MNEILVKHKSLLIKAGVTFDEESSSKKEKVEGSVSQVRVVGCSKNNKGKEVVRK